jgi:two-component system sensor kinase FixL
MGREGRQRKGCPPAPEGAPVSSAIEGGRQDNDDLRRSLHILRAVMEGTTDAVFVKDLQGRYLMINEAGARLVGKTVGDIIGKDDLELFSPDTARQIMNADQKTMAAGRTLTYEEVATAAGVTRTYLATKGPYRDDRGNVVGLIGISRDITARKQAEEALQRSEAKVRAILDAIPDAMFRVRRDGTFLELRGAKGALAKAFVPYAAPDDSPGRCFDDVLPKSVADACLKAAADALDRQEVQEFEYDLERPDGRHEFEARFVALGQDEVLAIVRDVTQRKRAEAQVRKLLGDLSRAARVTTVGEMATGLAHELNQPLMAIMNYASAATNLLGSPKARASELVACLTKLQSQAQTAAEIVRRVRGFLTHREPHFSTADLNALVQAAVDLDRSWSPDEVTRIDLELAPDLPQVHVDRVLLQQVVVNLIRNAREAMIELPVSERTITLTTSRCGAGHVSLTVRDYGPGIARDVAEHLFEPFRSTKPQGLGLGLSLSRSIIEAHRGRLEVDCPSLPDAQPATLSAASAAGQRGATFRFVLPIG